MYIKINHSWFLTPDNQCFFLRLRAFVVMFIEMISLSHFQWLLSSKNASNLEIILKGFVFEASTSMIKIGHFLWKDSQSQAIHVNS